MRFGISIQMVCLIKLQRYLFCDYSNCFLSLLTRLLQCLLPAANFKSRYSHLVKHRLYLANTFQYMQQLQFRNCTLMVKHRLYLANTFQYLQQLQFKNCTLMVKYRLYLANTFQHIQQLQLKNCTLICRCFPLVDSSAAAHGGRSTAPTKTGATQNSR